MNWPNWLPLRDNLRALSPYGAPQVPAQASLNTNENPYPPSAQLQAAITQAVSDVASQLNRYPDRDAELLRSKLGSYINNLSGTDFTLNNISTINSQVFTITNEIEKNTQTINSELQKFNEQIKEGKKENKLLKKKLGLTDNRIDDSEQLIEDHKEMYNLTYLKNFNKIIGIIIAGYILKQMFYS